jgi:hypothetical protein
MAELKSNAKKRGGIVIIEPKRFAITFKAPNSIREGFYESERYYRNIVEWVTTKVQEVSKSRRIFVYSLEAKAEHLMFWTDLAEVSKNELLARLGAKVEGSKRASLQRSPPKAHAFFVKIDNEGEFQILHFMSDSSKEVRKAHVHYEVRVAMPEKALAKKDGSLAEAAPNLLTTQLLSKFNTPELMQRRATAIAETNSGHTRQSDDALEEILTGFEKLSF